MLCVVLCLPRVVLFRFEYSFISVLFLSLMIGFRLCGLCCVCFVRVFVSFSEFVFVLEFGVGVGVGV